MMKKYCEGCPLCHNNELCLGARTHITNVSVEMCAACEQSYRIGLDNAKADIREKLKEVV